MHTFPIRHFNRAAICVVLVAMLSGCSYTKSVVSHLGYSIKQVVAPEQSDYKHMLNKDSYFVFGRVLHPKRINPDAVAVVALSDEIRVSEVVDVNHLAPNDTYFALNLPEGEYRILVVSDLDHDGRYDASEVVGGRRASLNRSTTKNLVLGGYDIDLAARSDVARGTFDVAVQRVSGRKGTSAAQWSLEDPLFSKRMATLGMYDPGAFLDAAPTLLYPLEEDGPQKTPIIFVHGINGSPTDFSAIVAKLDRNRYRPFVFYYPSGSDLKQLGALFYREVLSGQKSLWSNRPVLIVAHSMGGVVVREAFNQRTGKSGEVRVTRFVTLATPLGGLDSARQTGRAPIVVPSWRNLNPDGEFISGLHRRTLPAELEHHLLFAYGDTRTLKLGDNSDGVVALESQLVPIAQEGAKRLYGFNETHDGILTNDRAIDLIMGIVAASQ